MALEPYRRSRGLSQADVAEQLGLSSAGYVSRLERGSTPFPVRLALLVEAWSDGEVRAVDLLPPEDAQLLSQVISRASAPPAD